MSNPCFTNYVFHGEKMELEKLKNSILGWIAPSPGKNHWENSHLANILRGAGLGNGIDNPNPKLKIPCRGTIEEVQEICDNGKDCTFSVSTETAWEPMAKMWNEVISALKLNIGFSFSAEEPGNEIFWIYDPNKYNDFSRQEVYIDAAGDLKTEALYGYYTEEEAIKALNSFFNTDYSRLEDFSDLAEKYEDENEGSIIEIHRFTFDNELNQ